MIAYDNIILLRYYYSLFKMNEINFMIYFFDLGILRTSGILKGASQATVDSLDLVLLSDKVNSWPN